MGMIQRELALVQRLNPIVMVTVNSIIIRNIIHFRIVRVFSSGGPLINCHSTNIIFLETQILLVLFLFVFGDFLNVLLGVLGLLSINVLIF